MGSIIGPVKTNRTVSQQSSCLQIITSYMEATSLLSQAV